MSNARLESGCGRKCVREETLEAQFTGLFGRLPFGDAVLESRGSVSPTVTPSDAARRALEQQACKVRLAAPRSRSPFAGVVEMVFA